MAMMRRSRSRSLRGVGVDVAHQHALGGLHQGIGADHLARLHGGDAGLVDDGLQVGRAAALGHFHQVAQVQVGQHLVGALAQVVADDGQPLFPVGHAKVHLHLEAAQHGLVHLHGFAVEVAGHDPDDLGFVLAAHAIQHGQQRVRGVVVELAAAAALHEQVLRLVQEDDAALAPLGHGHDAAERIRAAGHEARFQVGGGVEQDGQPQFLGQVAGQLGLAGTRRAAEHHIEGLDDAVLGIFRAALILVLDLRHLGLDVVHAHQVVDGAVHLCRLDELERLELALELEVQEAQHAERQRDRQHAADAGLPAVLLGLRAGTGKALVQALEQFKAAGIELAARDEGKLAAPRRSDGLVGEDLGLHVAGVIRMQFALRFDQDDALRYVPQQRFVDHGDALDRVRFQEAQHRAGTEHHGQLVVERPRLPRSAAMVLTCSATAACFWMSMNE